MKKTVLLIPLFVAIYANANAQSSGPSTLNAAGGTATLGTNEFDWSIGEMTMVSTFTSAGIIVTQGLLQPAGNANEQVANNSLLAKQLHVFPNPATSVVNIAYSSSTLGTLDYRLMDISGQLICSQSVPVEQGVTSAQVDVSKLAAASYMLEVTISTGNNASKSTTYKIQKLN